MTERINLPDGGQLTVAETYGPFAVEVVRDDGGAVSILVAGVEVIRLDPADLGLDLNFIMDDDQFGCLVRLGVAAVAETAHRIGKIEVDVAR